MSRYLFGKDSLVNEISVQRSDGGGMRAYIYAREDAKPGELSEVKKLLTANSMQWTPIFIAGRNALEIRGLGNNEIGLMRLLHSEEKIVGSYEKKPNIGDVMTFGDKFKKNTLKASGVFYFAGDMGFFSHELKKSVKGGKLENLPGLLAGIFYALGTPVLVFFGRGDKSDFQLKHMAHTSIQELKKQGVTVPEDSALSAIANGYRSSTSRKIYNFLMRYPAEICNALFGVAGSMMIWEGAKDYTALKKGTLKDSKVRIFSDIGIGFVTVAAALVSVFVEEEARDPAEPKKHGVARAWQFITEKPLRLAGILLGISTVGHATSTVTMYQRKKAAGGAVDAGSLAGRALFTVTNLTAEGLMAMSSKGHGAGVKSDTSLVRSAYAMMADLVQRSPHVNKDVLLSKIADVLAGKQHLGGYSADIENGIRDQLKALSKNPWISSVKTPALEAPAKTEQKTNWVEKTTVMQPSASAAPVMM